MNGVIPLIGAEYVSPHLDHAGPVRHFVSLLPRMLSDGQFMIGIEESTALVGKAGETWKAMDQAQVYLLRRESARSSAVGYAIPIPERGGP